MERMVRKNTLPASPTGSSGSIQNADGLGQRLREVRQSRGLGVREIARRASVSASLVSQVELGRISPSVSTLYAMANALSLSVDELFKDGAREEKGSDDDKVKPPAKGLVQRSDSRQAIKLASGVVWERLTTTADKDLEFLYVVYDVGGASCAEDSMIRHGGKEYGYIVSGRLGIKIGFDEYEVSPGDSFSFDAHTPHRLWAIGDEPAVAIWVVLNRHGDEARDMAS
jgi:transcriptional regulator with XRE-family HTH domain